MFCQRTRSASTGSNVSEGDSTIKKKTHLHAMQRQHFVRLDDTLATIEQRVGTLKTAIRGSALAVRTQVAEIRVRITRAVEANHIVEQGGPYIKPSKHLGLKVCQRRERRKGLEDSRYRYLFSPSSSLAPR